MTVPPLTDALDAGEVRRRVLAVIDQSRRRAAERRTAVDAANAEWPNFLNNIAAPVFRQLAQALKAEGYGFTVHTPAQSLRLVSDRSAEDFIELVLDASSTPVQVVGRTQYVRGRRATLLERPVREGLGIGELVADDVLTYLLDALPPFVER